jgi:hypothetical protein
MTNYIRGPIPPSLLLREYIGIGQISMDAYEKYCIPDRGGDKGKDPKGWGEKYKVRMCLLNSDKTPDSDLISAERITPFPSGTGGVKMHAPLLPGTFVEVYRYYTGSSGTIRYVIGNTVNNPLCTVEKNKEGENKSGCKPTSGYPTGANQNLRVSSSNIDDSNIANLNGAGADCKFSQSDKDLAKLNKEVYLPPACKPFDSSAVNSAIKDLKKDIEGLRERINGPDSALSDAETFLREKQAIINGFADKITGYIKWLVGFIKEIVTRGVNWAVNKAKAAAFLNERVPLQEKKATTLDLILCLFNKIIDNLSKIIADFLEAAVDRYVNVAACAVEKFLTELVGQIIGQILGAVNGIINAVLGAISAIKGLIDSILDSISSLLDFLTCDVTAECAEVTEWNPLEGAKSSAVSLDVGRIINSAKSIISSFDSLASSVNPNNFNFNIDINSLISGVGDSCNVGPLLCGPPSINFLGGGGGQGASANAVIGAAGEILGIDVVGTGFGYTRAPIVSIEDSCGRGRGATAVARVGRVPYVPPPGGGEGETGGGGTGTGGGGAGTGAGTGTGAGGAGGTGTGAGGAGLRPRPGDIVDGIVDVIIIENGFGYLQKPDGSLGGDGRTWADRCRTKVRRDNGVWEFPYNPGETVDIRVGDLVQFPGETPFTATENSSVTAPPCPPEDAAIRDPSSSNGTFPVVLELVGAEILDPGFGFVDGEPITVTPSNGAELVPKIGNNGQITGIDVVRTGIGFTAVPEINIDSLNGYNAIIKPVFKVVKGEDVGTLRERGVLIINVVDCVGKPL